MADEKDLKQAQEVYAALCSALDANDWHYTRHDDDLAITSRFQGDDFPIEFSLQVDPKRNLLLLLSHLPVTVPEETRMELAVAVSVANQGMVYGGFDYNLMDGRIIFRLSNSYEGCKLGKEAFLAIVYTACGTIDRYNDKFLMLAKKMLTLEAFIQGENE